MKKQTKQMIVLLVVLAACLACYFGISRYLAHQQENQTDDAPTVGALSGELTGVTLAGEESELAFTCEGGVWSYTDPAFPVNQDTLADLAGLLTPLAAGRAMEITDSLEAYGLASPSYTLTASDAQGGSLTLLVGDANTNGDYYAMEQGGDTVYVLDSGLVSYLTMGLYDFMQLESFDKMNEANITALTLTVGGAEQPLVLTKQTVTTTIPAEEEGEEDTTETSYVWSLDGAELSGLTVSQDYLDSLGEDEEAAGLQDLLDDAVSTLSALAFDRCVDYQAPREELLGSSPAGTPIPLTVTVSYTNDDGAELSTTLYLGASNEDGDYLAMKDDSSYLYVLSADQAQPLFTLAQAL